MTPQERQLIVELFDRVSSLERNPRDADAVRAINEGLQRAPNALYALVQTALIQDEALKRADERIRALESEAGADNTQPPQQGGFLDSMRDALLGRPQGGSVPSVRPGAPRSPWNTSAAQRDGYGSSQGYAPQGGYAQQGGYPPATGGQQPMGGGSSFLGTAAASAAGVVGGALLMNSFRGMFGGGQGHSAFDSSSGNGAPWGSGGNLSDSSMAREAGLNDIGRGSGSGQGFAGDQQSAGLFESDQGGGNDDFDVGGGDFSGGSDSDNA